MDLNFLILRIKENALISTSSFTAWIYVELSSDNVFQYWRCLNHDKSRYTRKNFQFLNQLVFTMHSFIYTKTV